MGFFDNLLGLFTGKPAIDAAGSAQSRINAAFGQYGDFANRGIDALNQNYMAAINQFVPMQGYADRGMQQYLAALGLGGPQGRDAAVSSYIQGPGVQNAIAQATDAINRAGNAGGVAIGNTAKLGADAATNIALNDYYKNYVGALQPFLGMGQNIASGLGNLYTGLGRDVSSALFGQGRTGLDVAGGLGTLDQSKAAAGMAGAGNAVNLGLNIAKMFNPFGGMGTGGMGLGSAGSMSTGRLY